MTQHVRAGARRATVVAVALTTAVLTLVAVAAPGAGAAKGSTPKTSALLFALRADGGTFTPIEDSTTAFWLDLTGVAPTATWFTDRPNRQAGSDPIPETLSMIGFAPSDDPPNAVVDVHAASGDGGTIAVQLQAPSYDAEAGTLRFFATLLPKVPGKSLGSFAERLDTTPPASFGASSIFIDDADTPVDKNGQPLPPATTADWQYTVIWLKGGAPFTVEVTYGPNGHANCVGAVTQGTSQVTNTKEAWDGSFILGFEVHSSGGCLSDTSWQQWAVTLTVKDGSNPTGWDTGAKGATALTFNYYRHDMTTNCAQASIEMKGGSSGKTGAIACASGGGLATLTG